MVRHENIAEDLEAVFLACFFEDLLEGVSGGGGSQDVGVAVAADGDEVQVSGLLVSNETFGHGASLEESGSLTRITHPLR